MPKVQEKRKRHYSLEVIQDLIRVAGSRIITRKCRQEAEELGYYSEEKIVARVRRLTTSDFFKSMTTHADHTLWQDVYIAKEDDDPCSLYIKLQISADGKGVVIQLKKNTSGEY